LCAKIIDSRRYKTITKSQLEKKKKNNERLLKSEKNDYKKTNKYSTKSDNNSFISNLRIRKHREKKKEKELLLYSRPQRTIIKEPKQKIYVPKSFIIACCVVVGILLIYTSVKVTKIDEKIAETVFNNNDNEDIIVNLEQDYNLKIGLTSLDSTDVYNSTNLILNDLYKNISISLVKIENNYDITYKLARKIDKVTDSEYLVTLNDEYKLDINDIKYSIEKIQSYGENSMYYNTIANIESVESTDNKNEILIKLKASDPYFVYNLDFPILDDNNKVTCGYNYKSQQDSVLFERTEKSSNKNLKTITIESYSTIKEIVEDFTNKKIDVFFATSNNDMQLIGKNDYNVKKYKDGETLFILGNKNSDVFSKKEIRYALMYSLNRDEIVKSSDNNFIEIIDLPYLYSSIKYKYDIVGAKNIMNSNGWNQNSAGIYEKSENGIYLNATLKLLVNSEDENKLNVANNIKSMAYNAGINIEIDALTEEEIAQKIELSDYDIVLATVYLNETPNIDFLKEYIDINNETSQAFNQVEQSSIEDISSNIQNLEYVLSDEVACIGIYARNINLVCQKEIYGFNDINYMKIFSNISNIGKIIE
jgi:hypothetical protein